MAGFPEKPRAVSHESNHGHVLVPEIRMIKKLCFLIFFLLTLHDGSDASAPIAYPQFIEVFE